MKTRHALWQYFGSKWRLCLRLHAIFPKHRRYVDVFGGTGIVLARKRPSAEEVYNDLDWHCTNALKVVQDKRRCEELVQRLRCTRNDRQQYSDCKRLLRDRRADDITMAWAFLVCGAGVLHGNPAYGRIQPVVHRGKRLPRGACKQSCVS